MDKKQEIINTINRISGRYSAYEVFTDWIRCSALATSNAYQLSHDKVWQDREQAYLDTTKKYKKEELLEFSRMLIFLAEALEYKIEDVLGQVYMEGNMGSRAAGQFFTPYHLSRLCAGLVTSQPDEDGIFRLSEPSCGGGGMIIATADVLRERRIDYQRCMKVVAQDLDWKGVYMCYLQLSLLGIDAEVIQGNTLSEPYIRGNYPPDRVLLTPKRMGVLL